MSQKMGNFENMKDDSKKWRSWISITSAALFALILLGGVAAAEIDRPNILVIWGDDIGTWNISHNNRGMMGYATPNIDRIAAEGVGFTDYYA